MYSTVRKQIENRMHGYGQSIIRQQKYVHNRKHIQSKMTSLAPTFESTNRQNGVFNKDNKRYENYLQSENCYVEKRVSGKTRNGNLHDRFDRLTNTLKNDRSINNMTFNSNGNGNGYVSMSERGGMGENIMNEQYAHIDSVEVDYKEKTFQLMRKNTQLQLNMKQSVADVASLEQEVSRLSSLLNQIFDVLANIGNSNSSGNEHNTNNNNNNNHNNNNNNNNNNNSNSNNTFNNNNEYNSINSINSMIQDSNTLTSNIRELIKNISVHQESSRSKSRVQCEQQMKTIIESINKCKLINNNTNTINTNNNNNNVDNSVGLNSSEKAGTVDNIISKLTINQHRQSISSYTQTYTYHHNHNSSQPICSQPICSQPILWGCDCQTHFNQIIKQYQHIIDTQHTNTMRKQHSNQQLKHINHTLKLQLSTSNSKLQSYLHTIKQYQNSIKQYQNNIKQYQKNTKQYEHIVKQLQDKISQYITAQQLTSSINIKYIKQEEDIRTYKQQIHDTQALIQQKQKIIDQLISQNQTLYQQKQKINTKYKQQIVHFQQMEKLVQDKLIQVQFEMNFYKKQRNQNFQKIRKLKEQLRQYKTNQEKKYYSFGESQKDAAVQVKEQQLEQLHSQSYAEIIVGGDKTVTIKNRNPETIPKLNKMVKKLSIEQENLLRYSINSAESQLLVMTPRQSKHEHIQVVEEVQEIDSPERTHQKQKQIIQVIQEKEKEKEKEKDNWQIQCYQQSIKTLLNENNRLKQSLVKLYKHQQQHCRQESEISKEIELQMKILLSNVGNEQEEYQTEEDKNKKEIEEGDNQYGTVKKQ